MNQINSGRFLKSRYDYDDKKLFISLQLFWTGSTFLKLINPEKSDYQRDLMKFTVQTILRDLKRNQIEIYNSLSVGAKDRHHQFWERNPLSVPLYTQNIMRVQMSLDSRNITWTYNFQSNKSASSGKSFVVGDQKICLTCLLD